MIIQWIISIFVLAMILKLLIDLKNNKLSLRRFFSWVFVWVCLALIVFFPNLITYLAGIIGIERARDLPIYASIIVLFYLLFRVGIKIERVEQEITKLVKNLALKNRKK